MKINAIQNQDYMSYRKSNQNKIAFQGFNVQEIRKGMIHLLENGIDSYYHPITTPEEAKKMIGESKEIFKVLDEFSNAKFNLNDYIDRFDGYLKTAFKEFINEIGDKANNLPVKINTYGSHDRDFRYILPPETRIHAITHADDIYDEVTPSKDVYMYSSKNDGAATDASMDFLGDYDKMVGKANYFNFYPKSVEAVKDFLINCIERFILQPRAEELKAESANKLTREAADSLKNYAMAIGE